MDWRKCGKRMMEREEWKDNWNKYIQRNRLFTYVYMYPEWRSKVSTKRLVISTFFIEIFYYRSEEKVIHTAILIIYFCVFSVRMLANLFYKVDRVCSLFKMCKRRKIASIHPSVTRVVMSPV